MVSASPLSSRRTQSEQCLLRGGCGTRAADTPSSASRRRGLRRVATAPRVRWGDKEESSTGSYRQQEESTGSYRQQEESTGSYSPECGSAESSPRSPAAAARSDSWGRAGLFTAAAAPPPLPTRVSTSGSVSSLADGPRIHPSGSVSSLFFAADTDGPLLDPAAVREAKAKFAPLGARRRSSHGAAPNTLGYALQRARSRPSLASAGRGSEQRSSSGVDDALRLCRLGSNGRLDSNRHARRYLRSAETIQVFVLWRWSASRVHGMLRIQRAAGCIQRAFRSCTARQRLTERRRRYSVFHDAHAAAEDALGVSLVAGLYWPPHERVLFAAHVQAWWRAHLGRTRFARLRAATVWVQRTFRSRTSTRGLRHAIVQWVRRHTAAVRIACAFASARARQAAAARRRAVGASVAARAARERVHDKAAVRMQLAWRWWSARRERRARAAEARDVERRRVDIELSLFSLAAVPSWRSFLAVHRARLVFHSHLQRHVRARACQRAIDARAARERMQLPALVVLQQFARARAARWATHRRAQMLRQIASVLRVQTWLRRLLAARACARERALVEAAEDGRVRAEQARAAAEDEALSVWVRRAQAAWRGKVCRRQLKVARRRWWSERREWVERDWMAAFDYSLKDRNAAACFIQRAWRRETARWDLELRRDEYVGKHLLCRRYERSRAAARIQRVFRRFRSWKAAFLRPGLQIQLWWRVQHRLRMKRHQRCALIITRAFVVGFYNLRLRRLCNRIGLFWRRYVRVQKRHRAIRVWQCEGRMMLHTQAIRLQRFWRAARLRLSEARARQGITNAVMLVFGRVAYETEKLRLQIPTAGRLPAALPELVALVRQCLAGVAAAWAEEDEAREGCAAAERQGKAAILVQKAKARARLQRESRHAHILRRCERPAGRCTTHDLDTVLWNIHRIPVDVCLALRASRTVQSAPLEQLQRGALCTRFSRPATASPRKVPAEAAGARPTPPASPPAASRPPRRRPRTSLGRGGSGPVVTPTAAADFGIPHGP